MLTQLSIHDVVLIERLEMAFGPNLTVLTGETGAGKSILLDALGLVLGGRADTRLIRHGAERANISAEFTLPPSHPVFALLQEQGLDSLDMGEGLILRRILGRDGRSRAWVNDQTVSIGLLRQLGEMLVEIQGQFARTGLMAESTHCNFLDNYGGLTTVKQDCATACKLWRTIQAKRQAAEETTEKARREEDYLRHALAELEQLDPQPEEEQQLASERTLLQNAEKLLESLNEVVGALDGPSGADSQVQRAQKVLNQAAERAGGRLDEVVAALDRATLEIQEVISTLTTTAQDIRADDTRLNQVEERLFNLRGLARKHGVEPDALSDVMQKLRRELSLIEDGAAELEALRREEQQAYGAFQAAADMLSAQRHAAAQQLDEAVHDELPPLKLERAKFITAVELLPEEKWGENGKDRVAFQVATNPGAPPAPLGRTASGGELSRFLLALKVSLTQNAGTACTLIFDEVDSGIGGATAAAVGERLHRLADGVQILVVTHSPQVAARGAEHWRVEKTTAKDGKTVTTSTNHLVEGQRLEEIARMLSGAEITDEARAAAARLLEGNGPSL